MQYVVPVDDAADGRGVKERHGGTQHALQHARVEDARGPHHPRHTQVPEHDQRQTWGVGFIFDRVCIINNKQFQLTTTVSPKYIT